MIKYKLIDILTNRKRINKNIGGFVDKFRRYEKLTDIELLMIQIEITSKYNRSKMMLNVLFVTIIVSSFLGIGKSMFELMLSSVSRNDLILANGVSVRIFAISLFASVIFVVIAVLIVVFIFLIQNIKRLEEEKMVIDAVMSKKLEH